MFWQRLITSIILVPLVLCTILYAHSWILGGIVLLIALLAGREAWDLIPTQSLPNKIIFILLLISCIGLCNYLFDYWLTIGLLTWIIIFIAVITFPTSQRYWGYPIPVSILLLVQLPLFIQSMIRVYNLPQGKSIFIYLLFLIWAADIGAYITGKYIGRHKLIPKVSPGKSWEGVLGGFFLSMIISVLAYIYFAPYSKRLWFGLAALTIVTSIIGDLFISILKRRCNLKDTGILIPGHGGILDRLDSLIAATPWFYFGLTFIPIGI